MGGAAWGLLDICPLTPPLPLKEDGRCRLPSRPSLCRVALPTYPIGLVRAQERDHHCGTPFTGCVRMVHFERSVLSHLPTSSKVEVVQDPKAICKVSRQKTALVAAQEEFVELYEKCSPGVVALLLTEIDDALS
jgi:hypothetical protein